MMPDTVDAGRLGEVVLVRICANSARGMARTDLHRELANLFAHRLSPAEWREAAGVTTASLTAQGLIRQTKARISATPAGREAMARFLGRRPSASANWAEIRDTLLTAKALGLEGAAAARIKVLAKAEALRSAILDRTFDLGLPAEPTAAAVRHALAVKTAGTSARNGRPIEVERKAARGLLRYPLMLKTDREIVSWLAAEAVGAASADPAALRLAVLRKLFINQSAPHSSTVPNPAKTESQAAVAPSKPDRTHAKIEAAGDLSEFARCVLAAARRKAEGWPGNRKAFISHVWHSIRETDPHRYVSEVEFKTRLAAAHRAGHLTLTNADLRDKSKIGDVAASAVKYKNTEWHYVRVED